MIVITYVTQRGDNREKIKRKHLATFQLDDLLLEPNQLIHVPIRSDDGLRLIEYYTQKGDTLRTIAEAFHVDRSALDYFNCMDRLYICHGQTLSLSKETGTSMDHFDLSV